RLRRAQRRVWNARRVPDEERLRGVRAGLARDRIERGVDEVEDVAHGSLRRGLAAGRAIGPAARRLVGAAGRALELAEPALADPFLGVESRLAGGSGELAAEQRAVAADAGRRIVGIG